MPVIATLDKAVRVRGLMALTVLILDKDPLTTTAAASKPVVRADGSTEVGVEAAKLALVDALKADPEGWAEWLQDPLRVNAGTLLASVLTNELRKHLDANANVFPLVEALGALEKARRTRRH